MELGVISKPSARRAERLPEVPWLMPEAFIRRATATICSRSCCSSIAVQPLEALFTGRRHATLGDQG